MPGAHLAAVGLQQALLHNAALAACKFNLHLQQATKHSAVAGKECCQLASFMTMQATAGSTCVMSVEAVLCCV